MNVPRKMIGEDLCYKAWESARTMRDPSREDDHKPQAERHAEISAAVKGTLGAWGMPR